MNITSLNNISSFYQPTVDKTKNNDKRELSFEPVTLNPGSMHNGGVASLTFRKDELGNIYIKGWQGQGLTDIKIKQTSEGTYIKGFHFGKPTNLFLNKKSENLSSLVGILGGSGVTLDIEKRNNDTTVISGFNDSKFTVIKIAPNEYGGITAQGTQKGLPLILSMLANDKTCKVRGEQYNSPVYVSTNRPLLKEEQTAFLNYFITGVYFS